MKKVLSPPKHEGRAFPRATPTGAPATATQALPLSYRDSALSIPLLSSAGELPSSSPSSSARTTTNTNFSSSIDNESRSSSPRGEARLLPLVCMVLMAALCNFDHGAIPAVLSDIQEHFATIGYVEQSLLGSLVYIGVVSGTFLAGVSTHCARGTKWLLVASLLAASAALYGFSCSKSLAVMYTARFLVGFCQVSVYSFYEPDSAETRRRLLTSVPGAMLVIGFESFRCLCGSFLSSLSRRYPWSISLYG